MSVPALILTLPWYSCPLPTEAVWTAEQHDHPEAGFTQLLTQTNNIHCLSGKFLRGKDRRFRRYFFGYRFTDQEDVKCDSTDAFRSFSKKYTFMVINQCLFVRFSHFCLALFIDLNTFNLKNNLNCKLFLLQKVERWQRMTELEQRDQERCSLEFFTVGYFLCCFIRRFNDTKT